MNPTAAMIAKDSDEQYRFLYIDPNAHHHGEVEESIKLLFGTNYVLDYAASLEEAYPLIITKNYHLLISELDLPEGVGLQNLQCLKSWCGFSPTLIFTHLDDKDKALESVRMGATDYMIKGRGDANTLKRVIQYSLERAKIQNALHHNEELLRIFIQHTPAAIAMFDRDMNYIMASKRWLHDYSINEDVLGKNHYEVFDIPERWKIIHRQCLNGAIHKSEQDSFIGRQGVPEYIRWEVHPWYQGSNVGGLVMFTEVISDKVRMQRELEEAKEALEEKVWQRTQALEKAMQNAEMMNQSRVELFTNLTHELRTPLHAIINFSQFGLDKFNGASEEKLKGYYANINKSGHRLLRLVNDILDLAKVQSINIQLEPQHVTFNAIMQDALSEIQSLADQKGIRLCFDYEEDVTVYADAPRILQVMINLIGNAFKFSPANSSVTIRAYNGALKRRQSIPGFVISVLDEGEGIPENEVETIFDEFAQSKKVKSGSFVKGTGLGLAICKEIVHAHGGEIWAENRAEGGARLTFTLPLHPEHVIAKGR